MPRDDDGRAPTAQSAVSRHKRPADRREMVAHAPRAGDFEPIDEPSQFACKGVLVAAADHDLDSPVRPGTANGETTPEYPPEQAESFGSAGGLGLQRSALSIDLVGDLAPTRGKVESLGSFDGVAGQLD